MNNTRIIACSLLLCLLAACSGEQKKSPDAAPSGRTPTKQDQESKPTASPQPLRVDTLTEGMLPKELNFKGRLKAAMGWDDANGHNVLICTVSDPVKSGIGESGDPAYYSELLAWQYVRRDSGWAVLWKLSDNMRCGFDLTLGYIPGGASVTDLDGNGVAETTLIYKLACRSDVSPAEMKLIMHENDKKFALRGTMYINLNGMEDASVPKAEKPAENNICCLDDLNPKEMEELSGYLKTYGKYHNDKDFRGAPPAFLAFARKRWLAFVEEKFQ